MVHSTHYTAGNESDVAYSHEVLHGQETEVFMGAGYTGIEKRQEIVHTQSEGKLKPQVKFTTGMRRSIFNRMPEGKIKDLTTQIQTINAKIRARVEHVFHVVKSLSAWQDEAEKRAMKRP